ncbi:MAG TPA: hypothetical protein VIM84_07350 [Gemmatimonadales bacterium]
MALGARGRVFLIALVLGLGLWLVPQTFYGQAGPWDGSGPAYPLVLFGVGLLLGWFVPGKADAVAGGLFLGQLVVLLIRVLGSAETRAIWLVSVVMLAGYTFVAGGLGALLGGLLRRRLARPPAERRVSDRRM